MRVLLLSGFIVLVDQYTKFLVKGISLPFLGIQITGLPYGYSKPLIGNLVRLTYIENPGMAFGIDVGGKLFFSIFSVLASIAIVAYLYHARHDGLAFRLSLAMILGGAIGNLIDRLFYGVLFNEAPLFYGKVVDFVDVDFFHVKFLGHQINRWPVFNIADAAVTVGVIMLLFFHRSPSTAKAAREATALGEAPASSAGHDDGPPATGTPPRHSAD